jgi:hypothetical protein
MRNETNQISTWDRIMMAITFAEANEHATAREIMTGKEARRQAEVRKESTRHPDLRA